MRPAEEGEESDATFLQRILRRGLKVLGKIVQPPHFIRPNLEPRSPLILTLVRTSGAGARHKRKGPLG